MVSPDLTSLTASSTDCQTFDTWGAASGAAVAKNLAVVGYAVATKRPQSMFRESLTRAATMAK
jgi:hypothetical protein